MSEEKRNALTEEVMESMLSGVAASEGEEKEAQDSGESETRLLPEDLLAALSFMKGEADDEDDDDCDDEDKEANQYHNEATDLARHGRNRDAVGMCIRGLRKFPSNVDLLADVIKYSSDAGDMGTARRYFQILMEIPRRKWNWRAYTFVLDYLMEEACENETVIRLIIADYQKTLPHEEKAYVAESELEQTLGNRDRSREILEDAVMKLPNAPQASLRLADMQFESGQYEDVIRTTSYAFAACSEPQPSINVSYLVFLRLLAQDAALHQRLMRGDPITQVQIDQMREQYTTFQQAFPMAGRRFKGTITDRVGILSFAVPTA